MVNREKEEGERMAQNDLIEEWFQLYADPVYNFLLYYVRSGDVEDLVQEVFIKAMRGISAFKGKASPKTWLFSIARNVALDYLRKSKRSRLFTLFQDDMHSQNDSLSPEVLYQLDETKREIYQAIGTLRQNYQEVLIIRGIKECTIQETAAILNWSENKVKVTYHRALRALLKEVQLNGTVEQVGESIKFLS
jgi:RNA polymerase sigma-70 factor, ECF subfamily